MLGGATNFFYNWHAAIVPGIVGVPRGYNAEIVIREQRCRKLGLRLGKQFSGDTIYGELDRMNEPLRWWKIKIRQKMRAILTRDPLLFDATSIWYVLAGLCTVSRTWV